MTTTQSLVNALSLQLTEVDMLASMYPNTSEFHIDDPSVVADINSFIDGKSLTLPPRLDFTLVLQLESEVQLEMFANLPHEYPTVEPEIYVRSKALNRSQQHQLNEDLGQYVSELPKGELYVGSVIHWLQDHGPTYFSLPTREDHCNNDVHPPLQDSPDELNFSRFWIYSHHIFNKGKRRSILDLGHQLHLTGFCLPGKPGLICVEGPTRDCNTFWQRLKHMNWKKIILKKNEETEVRCGDMDSLRKFDQFEEVNFQCRRGPGLEYHMDMGEFFQFLEDHRCGYVFKDYFGVDGRVGHK